MGAKLNASTTALATLFRSLDEPPADPDRVGWYRARLPPAPGISLQALPGSGRLLLPLLEAGLRVHGIDPSEATLESCRSRLTKAGRETTFFRQDPAKLNLPFRYGGAFFADAAFQRLIDPVSALDALLRLRAHLVDPGVLLLDLWVPGEAAHPPGAPVIEVRRATLADGSQIALRSETRVEVDARLLTTVTRYELRLGAQSLARDDDTIVLTWYGEEEIKRLLGDAGFREVQVDPFPALAEPGRRYGVSARI